MAEAQLTASAATSSAFPLAPNPTAAAAPDGCPPAMPSAGDAALPTDMGKLSLHARAPLAIDAEALQAMWEATAQPLLELPCPATSPPVSAPMYSLRCAFRVFAAIQLAVWL